MDNWRVVRKCYGSEGGSLLIVADIDPNHGFDSHTGLTISPIVEHPDGISGRSIEDLRKRLDGMQAALDKPVLRVVGDDEFLELDEGPEVDWRTSWHRARERSRELAKQEVE